MPDFGERLAEENERKLVAATCRDPPPTNYATRLLERSSQQQQQQQPLSGGRKKCGGIMRLSNYKGFTVNIRVSRWTDNSFWINSDDYEAARYIADAAYHLTGRAPFHFPDAKFHYLPLLLSTGELLTTREKCSAHVAKIAKGLAHHALRKDFKDRAQKLILEMVKSREVVEYLNIMRGRQVHPSQCLPEANSEDIHSPFTDEENGTAMDVDTSSEDVRNLPLASTGIVNPPQLGNIISAGIPEEESHSGDGGDEISTPMEVDSLSEGAIHALSPMGNVDPASLIQFGSSITSSELDFDFSSSYIASFAMNVDERENFLTSTGQSLGVWPHFFGEKETQILIPENFKELMNLLDKGEEEIWNSTDWNSNPSDWKL